jgi:S1-C subfamily serine protease
MKTMRRVCLLPFAFCLIELLSLPATSHAGSREAVKKALAATVAVEWRADERADARLGVRNRRSSIARLRETQSIEADPTTGAETVRHTITAPPVHSRHVDLSLASGTVISPDGLVITLNRETADGHYDVIFADGRSLPARIVVDDRRSGLRLLKVDAHDLAHVAPADAGAEVGDQVYASFCTDRHERAAAQGMVAARHKTSWLQLDLTAGPMSAGGPLVDDQGRLIGIVSGRMAPHPRAETTNFAVPLEAVRALLAAKQGENTVVVHRGFLGIQLESKQDDGRERVIAHLLADSPAGAAGMVDGDELVKLAGEKVISAPDAAALVGRHAPGDKVAVVVSRDGQEKTLEITAGQSPAGLEAAQAAGTIAGGGGAGTANVVRPEKVYVLSEDGKRVAVVAEHVEALRNYARALRLRTPTDTEAAEPQANTIRVERSDLDKKLEEVGRSVESLQQQTKKLTEEIQALRSKLAEPR